MKTPPLAADFKPVLEYITPAGAKMMLYERTVAGIHQLVAVTLIRGNWVTTFMSGAQALTTTGAQRQVALTRLDSAMMRQGVNILLPLATVAVGIKLYGIARDRLAA